MLFLPSVLFARPALISSRERGLYGFLSNPGILTFQDSRARCGSSPEPGLCRPRGRPTEASSSLPWELSCVGSLLSSVLSPVFHLCVSCSTLWDVSLILFPSSSTKFFISTFIFLTSKSSFVCSKLPPFKAFPCARSCLSSLGPSCPWFGSGLHGGGFLQLRVSVSEGAMNACLHVACDVWDPGLPCGTHVVKCFLCLGAQIPASSGLVWTRGSTAPPMDLVWLDDRVC